MAALHCLRGPLAGQIIPLDRDQLLIGRNPDCDMVLSENAVSRRHASVLSIDSRFYLEDSKSRNGTFVNREKVEGRIPLVHNDQIQLGSSLFMFRLTDSPLKPADPVDSVDPDDFCVIGPLASPDLLRELNHLVLPLDPPPSQTPLPAPFVELLRSYAPAMEAGARLDLDRFVPDLLEALLSCFAQADFAVLFLKDAKAQTEDPS